MRRSVWQLVLIEFSSTSLVVEKYYRQLEKKKRKAAKLAEFLKDHSFFEREADEEDEFGNVIESRDRDEDLDDDELILKDPELRQFLSDEKINLREARSLISDLFK